MKSSLAKYSPQTPEVDFDLLFEEAPALDFELPPSRTEKSIIPFPMPPSKQRLERSREEFATADESLTSVYRFLYPHEPVSLPLEEETDRDLSEVAVLRQRVRSLESENTAMTLILAEHSALEVKIAMSGLASVGFASALIWESTAAVRIIHPAIAGMCFAASGAVFLLSVWRLRRDQQERK